MIKRGLTFHRNSKPTLTTPLSNSTQTRSTALQKGAYRFAKVPLLQRFLSLGCALSCSLAIAMDPGSIVERAWVLAACALSCRTIQGWLHIHCRLHPTAVKQQWSIMHRSCPSVGGA